MTFSVYFKVTLSLYQKHSVFCFIALPVTRTSPTVCPQQTTSGKCCSIPFKYRGVTFNSCTSADYHRPWCSLDPVYKERWGNCSKFNLTLVCISKLHYHIISKAFCVLFHSVTCHQNVTNCLPSTDNIRRMLQYSIQIQGSDLQFLHFC